MKTLILLSCVLSLARLVIADLPSHCLKWQVLGTWDFKLSAPEKDAPLCGHTRPDDIVSVYNKHLGYDNPGFEVASTGYFTLHSNFSSNATLCLGNTCENAKWTMVYDEAMVIKGLTSGLELLFQFVYIPRDTSTRIDPKVASKWRTFCDRTYPGWFGQTRGERGCAVAKNRVERHSQPSVSLMEDDAPDSLLHIRSGLKLAMEQSFKAHFMDQKTFQLSELEEEAILINSRQKAWVADASAASFALHLNNREAMKLVGGEKDKLLKPKSYSLETITDPVIRAKEQLRRQCIRKVLPDKWDWSESPLAGTPVINQGSCGSCYAVSSADAFTARLRLKKNDTNFDQRSSRAILMCSPTNQGCDGGFPYLVAHHAHYEGLYSERCTGPYSASPTANPKTPLGSCDFSSPVCQSDKEYAKDWGYVGGYYGRGNTEDMMWSLFRDGPLVVAINAQENLFMYRSGLFVVGAASSNDEIRESEAYWQATTHAVSLVGWGSVPVDGESVDSWKIKNSWGPQWGENGYFNIQRGVDAMAVESMAVHAIFGDGKPGNPDFERHVRSRLADIGNSDCTQAIEAMLAKELV